MADAKTVFSLTLQDLASMQLKQFAGTFSRTVAGIAGANDDGFAQLAANVGSVEGSLTLLGLTAPQVTMAMAALNAAGVAMDWARQAAEVESVRTSYERLAGGVGVAGQSMLRALREVSAGTIADRDLMLAANSAMALGVADTAQEMTSLLQVAIAKGAEFGVAPTKAFGNLINGLGRMSPEILNNIGVVVDAEAAYAAFAAQIGTTAAQLSDGQKMQALVNATLLANPGAAAAAAVAGDSAAAAFARWEVSTRQFSETMGTVFLPAATAGLDVATRFVDALAKAGDFPDTPQEMQLAGVDDQVAKWKDVWSRSFGTGEEDQFAAGQVAGFEQLRAAIALTATALEQGQPAAQEWQAAVSALAAEATENGSLTEEQAQAVAELAAQLRAATTAIGFTGSAYDTIAPKVEAVTLKLIEQAAAAREAVAAATAATGSQISGALLGMAGDLGAGKALALDQELNAELAERTRLMQSWGYNEKKIAYDNAAWTQQRLGGIREENQALQTLGETGREAGRQMAGGFASASQGLNDIQGKVSSLLSQSLTLDVAWPGKDGQDGGGDAINENAKRLAAIANEGLIGQDWMGEFAQEAPGTYADLMLKIAAGMNPQGAAQQLMAEFQAGMRPDLLDQGMIKERVKAMILGEASLAQTAQEIAAEVAAELGVSMPQALAAANQALGVQPAGGGDLGAGFVDGVDGDAAASGSLAKIAKAFLDNEGNVRTSGGVVGAWWGEGFMSVVGANVPPGLLGMLTDKLLPAILAAMAGRGSTTGTSDGGG